MHTTTPQFVLLCQFLVKSMEEVPRDRQEGEREAILDRMMGLLMKEGLVFDREFAGRLFDQLVQEEEAPAASVARLDELREKVRGQAYFNDAVLQSVGERLLWVLGPTR